MASREASAISKEVKILAKPSYRRLTVLFLLLGVATDQISTRVALTHPEIVESNPTTLALIDLKLWLAVDIFISTCMILVCYGMDVLGAEMRGWWTCWIFGGLRLAAGISNTYLYLSKIFI